MENNQNAVPDAISEVAAAEAEVRAAQERLDAARQRLASEQGAQASQAAQAWEMPQQDSAAQQATVPPSPYEVPQQGAADQGAQTAQASQAAQAAQGQPYYQQPYCQQPYQPYQQANQPYVQYVKTKDHLVAGLLAIFLGSLGIHKFYLGYNKTGVIMLCITLVGGLLSLGIASAIMGIIAFIEGIIYLVKPQPEFERIYVYSTKEWF